MHLRLLHSNQSHSSAVYGLCDHHAEGYFFSCSADRYAVLWYDDPLSQQALAIQMEYAVYAITYLKDHGLLIAGLSNGDFHVIDLLQKKEVRHIQHHRHGIYDFAYDRTDHQLIIAGGDGTLSIWSVPDFRLLRSIPLCEQKIRGLALSEDLSMLAIACGDGKVRVTDLIFFNEIGTIDGHEDGATSVAWHPKKPVLVSGGKDAHLKCWNINEQFRQVLSIPAHQFAIYSIVFDIHGKYCFTASRDKTIKVWGAQDFTPLQRIGPGSDGHNHSVNKLLCKGQKLISCGDDRKVNVFGW